MLTSFKRAFLCHCLHTWHVRHCHQVLRAEQVAEILQILEHTIHNQAVWKTTSLQYNVRMCV